MKILIVGLGNPGNKYANNRHNVGHLFIDYLSNKPTTHNPPASPAGRQHTTMFKKADTYMNHSGKAVNKLLTTHLPRRQAGNPQQTTLFVVHDDLDLKLGEFKISLGKGPKMHNGIASIEQHLKTTDFWRIRIGIDNRDPEHRISGEAYVLSDFRADEVEILQKTFPIISDQLMKQLASFR